MKSKIAFIVQRYGLEVNGGAEQHCRLLAEKLSEHYDVDVLTSCCESYVTWENFYPSGETYINNVRVIRFPTLNPRRVNRDTYRFICRRRIYQKVSKAFGLLGLTEALFPKSKPTKTDFDQWVEEQGPNVPDLIDYLSKHHKNYKALIFFTYLYYPTINGLEICPKKSILIPTAHDEKPIYIPFFKRVFHLPKVIIYNTLFEMQFVNKLFKNQQLDSSIAGVGIEFPEIASPIDIKQNFNINKKYLVYVGRIEAGKGCKQLITFFKRYNSRNSNSLQLVLAGKALMSMPDDRDIISLGFVTEEVKQSIIKQAEALIMPSKYESLSMVTLEAMKLEVPVIVNKKCVVLDDQIKLSGAGFSYSNYKDFEKAVNQLVTNKQLSKTMGRLGKKYVEENYDWDRIVKLFVSKIQDL